ncbi:MAG TPA: hypothetical protein VFO77_08690 [Actinoplanes sp.]|nr:hypothetical protein [Actinoplanes sp.]
MGTRNSGGQRPVRRRPGDVRAWLRTRPTLDELRETFPAEWRTVEREIGHRAQHATAAELQAYVAELTAPTPSGRPRKNTVGTGNDALSLEIRRHMTVAALKQVCLATATGVEQGRVRFNLLNGWVAQKLLFARGLQRKPVSMTWFRLVWPLLWQRRMLMPLVGPKGIYCFYSRPLIRELAELIGDRRCVEIAAGDGTLARFLTEAGTPVIATDDHSWAHAVSYPDDVERLDARRALRRHQPQVVICSWPPAGNSFERDVFRTPSVQLYIVIGSRHRFSAGNWDAYEQQQDFVLAEDPRLSALVLPPELDSAVYLFRRIDPAG